MNIMQQSRKIEPFFIAFLLFSHFSSVTVDDLLCDNLIRARVQMERDIQAVLEGCDDYEIRVVKSVAQATVAALRQNKALKDE